MSTRNTRSRKSAPLSLERLEGRELKAGNVAIWVDTAGTLNVSGDGNSNGVAITQVAPTAYRVTGLNHYGATTINGRSSVVMYNVYNDIAVNLGNGDDHLSIGGTTTGGQATLADDLFIAMGSGNDTVVLSALRNRDFNDYMYIDTGFGADTVHLSQVRCNAGLTVDTGADNDRFTMQYSSAGSVFAAMGAGNDLADLRFNSFGSTPTLEMGTGFDTVTLRGNNRPVMVYNYEQQT